MTPVRAALLTDLAAQILQCGPGRLRVGVDGVDGAGKTVFAAELAAAVRDLGRPAVTSSADGFHHPRAVRYRQGRDSPVGFVEDSYDLVALRAVLLAPWGPDGDGRYRAAVFDHRRDSPLDTPWQWAPPGAVLIVDGLFLHRPQLRDAWDFTVFLKVDFATTYARMSTRDGCPADPDHPANRRYRDGQRWYLSTCDPLRRASVVVDNADLATPRIIPRPG